MKKVTKLEHDTRVVALSKEVIEMPHSLAFNFTIFISVKGNKFIPPPTSTLPTNYIAMPAINETIRELSATQAEALQCTQRAD
jgi:hypothetical protein